MTQQTAAIKRIQAASRKRDAADAAKQEATEELRHYCKEARAVGISISHIANFAGLSRQTIYSLLNGQTAGSRFIT